MKRIKFLLVLTFVVFASCSKDEVIDTTPKTQEVKATIDATSLTNLAGNDATSLVTFDGVPAATHTTEAIVGDRIEYKVDTSDPNTIVRFTEYQYASGSRSLWENGLETVQNDGDWLVGLRVRQGAISGQELKFNMKFILEVNGVLQTNKVYIIDPKIKIKSKR